MKKYFFVLGRHPELSVAEIINKFQASKFNLINEEVLLMESEGRINPERLISFLGGTVKIGAIESSALEKNLKEKVFNLIIKHKLKSKLKFGFSYYGPGYLDLKKIGMALKRFLAEKNISSRLVVSRAKNLSSVVIEQNKLIGSGGEIVLIKDKDKFLIGRTLAVQPFKDLSFRDYGRPARDDRSGMLPPKLAQIMINLAQAEKNQALLDPFCGSGTILTEAALMGYKNLIGSDISQKAVQGTKKNIEWLEANYQLAGIKRKLFNVSVFEILNKIKPDSIRAIVTEPYLGPQRGKINIKEIIPELENLYSQALKNFREILKYNCRAVMVWPIFLNRKKEAINPKIKGFEITNPFPKDIFKDKFIKTSSRNSLIYGRRGQKIWREIIILTKK